MNIDSASSRFGLPPISRFVFGLVGVIAGFILCRLLFAGFTVSDASMSPNYKSGDRVYALRVGTPHAGDVVLVESPVEPGKYLLKRVAAVEGDVVELRNRVIYINNERAQFKWKTVSTDTRVFPMSFSGRDNMTAVKIERHSFFLLGDNVDHSFDSREFGPVTKEAIVGRVLYRH